MQWWWATSGAIILGIATNVIYDVIKYGGIRVPRIVDRRSLTSSAAAHDVAAEGLYPLATWSVARPLTPQRLITTFGGRHPTAHLLDTPEWRLAVADLSEQGMAGRTAYVSSLAIDTGEHPRAQQLRVTISESQYAECLASKQLVNSMPALAAKVHTALKQGHEAFVPVAPPTMVSACIAVTSRRNHMIVLRRSLGVTTYPHQWTIGINESMKYSDEPGAEEDFFSLVRRGLREELGLNESDYGTISISWFGWSQDAACYVIVASVRSGLTDSEIDRKRQQCHSVYEHDLVRWLPLRRKVISDIVLGRRSPGRGSWSYLAPLVALEVWRTRRG